MICLSFYRRFVLIYSKMSASLTADQLRERRRQKILARSQVSSRIVRYNELDEGTSWLLVSGRGLFLMNMTDYNCIRN